MNARAVLVCASIIASAHSWAWIDTGHMLVAKIAEGRLSPRAKQVAKDLLKIDVQAKTRDFVTAACWADDVKSVDDREWYYINFHFRTDGKTTTNTPPPVNVISAISAQSKILGDASESPEAKSRALKYLLHLVGDIFQPLHTMARDTDAFPKGDRGGNDFKIAPMSDWTPRPIQSLHLLWDFGCGLYRDLPRPLDSKDGRKLADLADSITREFPYNSTALKGIEDPKKWADDAYSFRRVVYGTPEGQRPSDEYLKNGQSISRKQIAKAGYALADLLNRLLK